MNLTPIKALVIGWIVGPGCTLFASLINGYFSPHLISLFQFPLAISLYFILSNYIIHASFAFLSGYIAATIAKKHVYIYAILIALTGIVLQLLINKQVQTHTQFQTSLPFDYYFSLFITLPFAYGGAYVATRHLK